jgi:hypothetical protein
MDLLAAYADVIDRADRRVQVALERYRSADTVVELQQAEAALIPAVQLVVVLTELRSFDALSP